MPTSREIFQQKRCSLDVVIKRLLEPVGSVSMQELLALWQQSDIIIYVNRPKNFDNGFSLANRIRGALGAHLENFEISLPFEVMFGKGWHPPGQSMRTRPYIIECRTEDNIIKIRLGLFGFFRNWAEEIKEILIKALRGGIALYPGCRTSTTFDILHEYILFHVHAPEFNPGISSRCMMKFDSPLCLNRGNRILGHDREILFMLLDRIISLARWQDLAVNDIENYREAFLNICYDSSNLRVVFSERYSSVHGRGALIMIGCVGSVFFEGSIDTIGSLLQIGALCGFGSYTTMGMGHYGLSVY